MLKAQAVVYQRVYVCTLKTSKLRPKHMSALEQYVDSQAHDGLTGILMQGESAIFGLVEGDQKLVQTFISNAHPDAVWLNRGLMTQTSSASRLYPGLALRLRPHCAMPELMAFAADLRRSSKHDATWHADNKSLAQWLEPVSETVEKGVKHAL